MLKRHGSSVELLPHDVVELMLERLSVESLLRFKLVSKKWKLTIESRRFQEGQSIRRKQSRGPDVLCVCLNNHSDSDDDDDGLDTDVGTIDDHHGNDNLDTDDRSIVFGSSIASTVRFPSSVSNFCHGSCDGLLCFYTLYEPRVNVVVNPATRWHRSFPLSSYQQLLIEKADRFTLSSPTPELGFGKDNLRGMYKPVWLYNSSGFNLDNVTTCEVFDFSTNAWRYVLLASPYRIRSFQRPVYLDGSLYWFTECEETKVLSFDLHTETFQVLAKDHFLKLHVRNPGDASMCILDHRLCVSMYKWPTQVIWSFDSSGGSKAWKKLCSLDLTRTYSWFRRCSLLPIAFLEKNKLLLHGPGSVQPLVIHDLHAISYELLFKPTKPVGSVYYFESLFSVLSN